MGPAASGSKPGDGTRGSFGVGFLQPLGIYLATIALFTGVQVAAGPGLRDHRYPLQGAAATMLAILACVLVGLWHQRRGRDRAAAGLFVGVLVWPVVLVALFLGFVAYRFSQGPFVAP